MNLSVHIERLVLEGVALGPGQQHPLQAAIQAELTRLITTGGLAAELAAGLALPRVSAPALTLPADGDGAALGCKIAASVYGGIGR